MPRQARIDTAGALHHVIIRGIERRRIFRSDYDRQNFVKRLSELIPAAVSRSSKRGEAIEKENRYELLGRKLDSRGDAGNAENR